MTKTVEPDAVCSAQQLREELGIKRARVQVLLTEHGLNAILIARHENIAWFTVGQVDVRVGVLRETGSASLLVTDDDRVFYLTTNNEAARLDAEEFSELEFSPLIQPWYAMDQGEAVCSVMGDGVVGSDVSSGAMPLVSMAELRAELTEGEIARYRWLGARVAETATALLLAVAPGETERGLQAKLGERLLGQGILPAVYLDAFDHRIRSYRHAVPRGGVLDRFGMLGFCARRWGLSVSITRFVHFGRMPVELEEKFAAVAEVNARLLASTRVGATGDSLFGVARDAYAALDFAGEETMHHQGGAAGYLEREWVARPGSKDQVKTPQAFAWNPNLQGAKVEDTVLLQDDTIGILTATPHLPVVTTLWDGGEYRSAGVLLR